ncbi:MAG: POTRA domain-containing protein [Saprospiraceae bacterium]
MFRYLVSVYFLFFWIQSINGQSNHVVISHISVVGNQKTKGEAILRELDVSVNDSIDISVLSGILLENEKRLLSTGLFSKADVNIKQWDTDSNRVHLEIMVKEGWFIYPYVIFELADRNFNVWARDFNYSFQRLNYGVALTHINFSGAKDKLKAKLQFGFTGKYELHYEYPYWKNGWGFAGNFFYTYNKEISYKTLNNRPAFYKSSEEKNLLWQNRLSFSISKRGSAYTFHNWRIQYNYGKVDTIIPTEFNGDFFLNNKTNLGFLRFEYEYIFNRLLYPLYPDGGYWWRLLLRKDGFGGNGSINNTLFSIEHARHWPIVPWLIMSNSFKLKGNLQRNKIPYLYNQALGYENDVITGYQLYVVDGTDFFYSKNALKLRIFAKNFHFKGWVPNRFTPFNSQIFLRLNMDIGFVNEPSYKEGNPLANTLLLGYGPAIDAVFFHNLLFSVDFSINKSGETGFFFSGGFQF